MEIKKYLTISIIDDDDISIAIVAKDVRDIYRLAKLLEAYGVNVTVSGVSRCG